MRARRRCFCRHVRRGWEHTNAFICFSLLWSNDSSLLSTLTSMASRIYFANCNMRISSHHTSMVTMRADGDGSAVTYTGGGSDQMLSYASNYYEATIHYFWSLSAPWICVCFSQNSTRKNSSRYIHRGWAPVGTWRRFVYLFINPDADFLLSDHRRVIWEVKKAVHRGIPCIFRWLWLMQQIFLLLEDEFCASIGHVGSDCDRIQILSGDPWPSSRACMC